MAAHALGRHRLARMANLANDSAVCSGQRKGAVIRGRGDPAQHGVAFLALRRESGLDVVRLLGPLAVLLVAAHALDGHGFLVVTARAGDVGVLADQGQPPVGELGRGPLLLCVALVAALGKAANCVVGDLDALAIFHMAAHAILPGVCGAISAVASAQQQE